MPVSNSTYFQLATREGFNAADSHIENTVAILNACENKKNIADEINQYIIEKKFTNTELTPTVYMLLVEKWGYTVLSRNLKASPRSAESVLQEISKWNAVDIVLVYHHPDLGEIVVNPKNPSHADFISDFRKNELVVIFAGFYGSAHTNKNNDASLAELACKKCVDVLEGNKTATPVSLTKGSFGFKSDKSVKPALKAAGTSVNKKSAGTKNASKAAGTSGAKKSAAPDAGQNGAAQTAYQDEAVSLSSNKLRKMSPILSVPVTNELFHNGNVEAWKRIIESYNSKYPDLQINVYYEGERIIDINTLFKWGKVKHGSSIQFAVLGEDIQDVAKLKRYFMQGASNQFEAFLRNAPGTILKLF